MRPRVCNVMLFEPKEVSWSPALEKWHLAGPHVGNVTFFNQRRSDGPPWIAKIFTSSRRSVGARGPVH